MAQPKPAPDQQTKKLQGYLTPALFRAILLLLLSDTIVSQSIIKTLPGFPSDLPFELETGYIGVGERDEVQLFYYFLESERNPRDDPLILWMAGGPGCSSLFSFFYEIGPLKFNFTLNPSNSGESKPTLELNPYSWTKVANIIFIDQPAGCGFSYAKTWEAYNSSDTRSASLTYDFLRKWLVDHPKFLNNPLYIGGISYIGIVVPIVVQEIYNGNEAGKEPRMNIKVNDYIKHLHWAGYILFNPLTDKNSDINSRVPYAHRVALLSDQLYESAKSNCQGVYIAVDPDNRLCASDLELVNECVEKIYSDSILEPVCLTTISKPNLLRRYRSSLEENHIDIIPSLPRLSEPWCRDNTYKAAAAWTNDKAVQNALHIREGTITEWVRCNKSIQYSVGLSETVSYTFNVLSSVDYHRNLTNKKCRALIASGDHDMVVPHLGTEKWIRSLNLTIESGWEPWFVEGQVAGYTVSYIHHDYSLTYATAKGAGHTGPEHKPKEYLAMVDRWFAYSPL